MSGPRSSGAAERGCSRNGRGIVDPGLKMMGAGRPGLSLCRFVLARFEPVLPRRHSESLPGRRAGTQLDRPQTPHIVRAQ